jgi:hypothetical protein
VFEICLKIAASLVREVIGSEKWQEFTFKLEAKAFGDAFG